MAEVALRIDPEDQTVDPGQAALFTINVMNLSGVVDRVALDVLGPAAAWSRIEPHEVPLFPGSEATAMLILTPPPGTPLGQVPVGVRATSASSGFVDVGETSLNVGATWTVEAELRPRTAVGKRRAASVIVLHNLGNAATSVSLAMTDPDDAIVFDAPAAVQIGPGSVVEVPLQMRLPSRQKHGSTLPYQVLLEGDDTAQSLDGQVRQPPRTRLPVLAALAALGLVALAFLLLKPDDSVAIKADNAGDSPTTTTLGDSTSVPEAGTVGGPADPGAPGGEPAPGEVSTTVPGPGVTSGSVPPVVTPATPSPPLPPVTPTTRTKAVTCTAPSTAPPAPGSPEVVGGMKTVPRNRSTEVVSTVVGDGSQIFVKAIPTPPRHGTAVVSADKTRITYTPARDYTGNDSFVYTVGDSRGEATAQLHLCVQ